MARTEQFDESFGEFKRLLREVHIMKLIFAKASEIL